MYHPLPVTVGGHQPLASAIQHQDGGQTNFSSIFQMQEVGAFPDVFAWSGFKNHHQEGFPPQAAISAVVPLIKLFPVSNLKVLCCSVRRCREVFTCLCYSCLCSLAKEWKLAQVHLPSAHCWYVDHGARWGNGLHVWKTLFSFPLLSVLPLSPPSFVPWYFGSLGCHAFDSYWLVQITML